MHSQIWMDGYNYLMARTANPYPRDSVEHRDWFDGWTHRFRGIPIDEPLPQDLFDEYCGISDDELIRRHAIARQAHAMADEAAFENRGEIPEGEIILAGPAPKRGRPPGSKNKTIGNGNSLSMIPTATGQKRRGRPPGSKNKKKG
jgi:hypothetical protein